MKKLILLSLLTLSFTTHAAPPGREVRPKSETGTHESKLREELSKLQRREVKPSDLPLIASRLIDSATSSIPNSIMLMMSQEVAGLKHLVLKSSGSGEVRMSDFSLSLREILKLTDATHSENTPAAKRAAMALFLIASAGNSSKIMPILGSGSTPGQVITISKAIAELQGSTEYNYAFQLGYARGVRNGKDILTALREADIEVPATTEANLNVRNDLNQIVSDALANQDL